MDRIGHQRNRGAGCSKGQRQALGNHLSCTKHTGQYGSRYHRAAHAKQTARGTRHSAQDTEPWPAKT